jgi:predicted permease
LDWRVIAFAVMVGASTTLIFGLVPAIRATRTDLTGDLRRGAYGLGASTSSGLREAIVALELGLAVVLVVGCGLLLASYSRLRTTPLGFEPDRLLTFMIRPPEVRYPPATAPLLIDRVLEEISQVPGVDAVTVDGCAPLTMQCATAAVHIVGRPLPPGAEAPVVSRHYVAPDHFQVLGAAMVRGRGIEAGDRAGRPHVVVINEAAVRRFWPNAEPIGQRVWFEGAQAFDRPDASAEIVGIVRDVAYRPLDEEPIQPGFFTPYAQFTYATRMVLVRAQGDPRRLVGAVATAVRRADPDLALFDVQTMDERARLSWSKQRAQTSLLLIIATIALTLAATGVYAVTAFFVTSNRREIGLRIALGASAARIARHSLARTARMGVVGGAVGMLGGVATSQVLRATLYETSPLDPVVYVAAGVVLAAAFLAASYVPIRRAMHVDPVEILRSE